MNSYDEMFYELRALSEMDREEERLINRNACRDELDALRSQLIRELGESFYLLLYLNCLTAVAVALLVLESVLR